MRKFMSKGLVIAGLLLFTTWASADIFNANATIFLDGKDQPATSTHAIASNNLINFIDQFENIQNTVAWNNQVSALTGEADVRGLMFSVNTSVTEGIRTLTFCMVGGNCVELQQDVGSPTYSAKNKTGAVNDIPTTDIWTQLVDYLQGKGIAGVPNDASAILNQWSDAWVSSTSLDPVAGNPNSFMAQLANNNFNLAADGVLNGDTSGLDLFSLTPSYSNVTNNGFTVKNAYLPIKYSHYFNQNNALIIDMPISYQQVDSATTYSLALGFAYTHVILRTQQQLAWALTPSFHAGAVGSIDLGSGTMVYDGGLASRVSMPIGRWTYGVTNDVSYLDTAKVKVGSVETPYELENWITENGVDATFGMTKSLKLGGYYNRFDEFHGQAWYIPNYNEVGIKFADQSMYQSAAYDFLTAAVGYQFGPEKFNGVNVTLGVNF